MNAIIKSENGKSWIECFYNPSTCNWNEAIQMAYSVLGVRPGQMKVVCSPCRRIKRHNNNSQIPLV